MTGAADSKRKSRKSYSTDPARLAAARILLAVFEQGAYANLGSVQLLEQADLTSLDRRFASALVYGTISRVWTIDWILAQASSRPVEALDPWVRTVLRLGVWQLCWSRSVPPTAAVDESVRLASRGAHSGDSAGRKGDAGFVNAVLRRLAERPIELPAGNLPVKAGLPPKLFGYLRKWFGETEAIQLAESFLESEGTVTARVNNLRTTNEAVRQILLEQGVDTESGRFCPEAIRLDLHGQSVRSLNAWQTGLLSIQDEAAMLVGHVAAPVPGTDNLIIDLCAAPGGKTCHLAELTGDRTPILAFDIHPARLALIQEHALRLGLGSITCRLADAAAKTVAAGHASESDEQPEQDPFSGLNGRAALVLADVPCSGLGLLGRKPEISLHMTHEKIIGLYPLQAAILRRAGSLVRPGGTLVYSTCTINPAENIEQVLQFIKDSAGEFELDPINDKIPPGLLQDPDIVRQAAAGWLQILPHHHHIDGFFIARMKRVKIHEQTFSLRS